MRKLLTTMFLLILFTTTVFATDVDSIYVDGNAVKLDAPLLNTNATNYIPVNTVVKGLGATITWSGDTATIKDKNTTLILTVDSNKYVKNGTAFYSPYKPIKANNQVYVHLKFIFNNLGYTVSHQSNPVKISVDTTKPATWDNYYVDDNSSFTKTTDGKYGFKISSVYENNKYSNIIYVKNISTGEFKEVHKNQGTPDPTWSNDNKLIFDSYEAPYLKYMLYDPATNKISLIATGSNNQQLGAAGGKVYVQSKNCLIYTLGNINTSDFSYYSYDTTTNKSTKITKALYDEYAKIQADKVGNGKLYTIYIDDKKLDMDIAPLSKRDTTFVPIGFISTELGATVSWSSPNVTIKKDDLNLVLTVGSNAYTKNGQTFYTQHKPFISNGRTFVPLRFVSNMFGYGVGYDSKNNTITINTTKKVTPDNSFVDDNSTFILSPSKKYGYKNGGTGGEMIIFVKNLETGWFKEVYDTVASEYSAWLYNDTLLLRGNKDITGVKDRDHYMIYDLATDTLTDIANARYGDYVEELDIFVYSTTEYRSDMTSDNGSTFYKKDMKTGKVTTITKDEFYKYMDMEEKYRQSHYTYPY